eukprot:TRINITY_DN13688_c0_g1_i10.p2 TRINITY_DN13688_c0_g1~~TRINITY_DN13688_c0_g1_i10.p2  ORF type:complete len:162 (-),score=61.75 TRINITY_DN13688_c0_g1_i10:233-673(-)
MGTHQTSLVMEAFKGKYERIAAENFEEFLKALDVGMLVRKAATISTPVMEISEAGGIWSLKTSTTLKTMELKFKLGEKFDETTPDGRETSAVVTFDSGKIVTVQTAKKAGQKSTRSVRELAGPDELVYTMMIEGSDVACTQTFKRL